MMNKKGTGSMFTHNHRHYTVSVSEPSPENKTALSANEQVKLLRALIKSGLITPSCVIGVDYVRRQKT